MPYTSLPPQAPSTPAPIVVQIPEPPIPPTPPTIVFSQGGSGRFPVPQNPAQLAILQNQRDVLSSQIGNVRERRNEIARAYERASGANRSGLEQQLRVLDQRLLQLEQDLAESGQALARSQVSTSISTAVPFRFMNLNSGQMTAISIVFILFVLGPIATSLSRLFWRRASKPAMPPGWYDASQRLERLEQAVDTIAVEVERVSEGQRFITKLMTQAPSENAGVAGASVNGAQPLPALGAGSPEPIIGQKQRDEVRVRRS